MESKIINYWIWQKGNRYIDREHIYREKLVVTSEKGKEEGQYRDRGLRGTNYYV